MEDAIGMIRHTERFEVDWGEAFEAISVTEEHKHEIAHFYHRTAAPLYHQPSGGTLEQALYDVERYLNYHRRLSRYPLFLKASTLVYDRRTHDLVGICLCAGSKTEGHIFSIFVDPAYRRKGLATKMLQRALTVFADEYGVIDLEADPNGAGRFVYEKLGFVRLS